MRNSIEETEMLLEQCLQAAKEGKTELVICEPISKGARDNLANSGIKVICEQDLILGNNTLDHFIPERFILSGWA